MIYRGFCGPSSQSQSLIADAERTVNWYVEHLDSPYAPTDAALYPVPGTKLFASVADVTTRALFSMNSRCFAVIGPSLYEVFANQTMTLRGSQGQLGQDSNPATISANGPVGNQLGITSNGNWFNYDLGGNVLTQVAALNGKATMGGMKDGYFLCFNVNNGTVYVSNINDGTTWQTGTMFYQRTIAPDPWKAMVVGNPYIYMLGELTSEAWYDAGNSPQPFAPILSSFMQYGTPSTFGSGMAEDALLFLSRDRNGQGIVCSARGYYPQAVSNYAVNTAIQGYARTSTINDAELMVYQDVGHLFANFGFPSADATWSVDTKGGALWHERGFWDTMNNKYRLWRPRAHCYAFGVHLVGDRSTGNLYTLDTTYSSESDGSVIRRLRMGPPLWATSRQRLQIDRFQIQVEPGLGTGQGSTSPQMMFRSSRDAKTWSHERRMSAGATGQYRTRVYLTLLGSSTKVWIPEITCTDKVAWRLSGAEIQGRGFEQTRQAA